MASGRGDGTHHAQRGRHKVLHHGPAPLVSPSNLYVAHDSQEVSAWREEVTEERKRTMWAVYCFDKYAFLRVVQSTLLTSQDDSWFWSSTTSAAIWCVT
jgi:hypothetical protein